MAEKLYELGRWCFRRRGRVISVWASLLLLGVLGAVFLSGPTSDSFDLPDTESSRAFALIEERTPQAATDGATARVVVRAPAGATVTDATHRQAVTAALRTATTGHVASVADPYTSGTVSADGRTAYATISYDRASPDLTAGDQKAVDRAVDRLHDAGLTAAVGGDAFNEPPHGASGEAIGVVVALLVLLITFGSLVAAGMPLLTAVVGVGIGILGVTTLTGFVDLSSVTPALASMLGLAVGVDYALFIMSRFQHEIRAGRAPEQAAGVAIGTAGSAVVFAGATVIIALAGFAVTGVSFLTQMGLAAAATVAVAVLIALTLLPALLGLAGRRVTGGGRIPGLRSRDPEGDTVRTNGRRWVELVVRFRLPVLLTGLAAAVVMSLPVLSLQLSLPDDGTAPADSSRRQAYDLIADSFGAGANGPLVVVVDTKGAADPQAAVDATTKAVQGAGDDVAAVVPPVTDPTDTKAVAAFRQQLQATGYAVITVVPRSGPSSEATKDLVDTLRDRFATLERTTGAPALVTGQTAVGVDISQTLSDAFPRYLLLVVGLAFVLLVLVFRSLLVPLKATLGFLLSVGVSLGATVAVFQWGWLDQLVGIDTTSPVVFIIPLLLTGILFGLAMDYEVFLVTRMREEHVHGSPARQAVVLGFQHSARVVTAAAFIMVGVFAGFALGDDMIIKSIGFALAVGVLADAFLVRMTIVPALMALVGKHMWWIPRWLDRALPDLDVEGERLGRRLAVAEQRVVERV